MNFYIWKCPTCGYRITDTELQSTRTDYGCPKCETSLGEFQAYLIEESKQASEAIKESTR